MNENKPLLCIVTPRNYPIKGGLESYTLDVARKVSSTFNTILVTSNLNRISKNIFENYSFIEEKQDLINENIKIIRANTLKNILLKYVFFFNQFLNYKLEKHIDKLINPSIYSLKKNFNPKNLEGLSRFLLYQRSFSNPNFHQIYTILKKIHEKKKINIIHSTPIYFTSNYYAFKFAKKNKIPFINEPFYHINPYADYILYPSYQYTLKHADIVIAQTNIEKEYFIKYGVDENKIHVIPVGINPREYKEPDIIQFKKKYKIPENCSLLLFLGRRTIEKGVFQCILALKHLIKKNNNVRLMIAGPMTRNYELLFENISSDIKKYIIDLGFIDEDTKSAAFACCDVFLSPSLDDGFGIVYTEAWLFKKPVIGVLEGNVAGVVDNNKNGFLVPFKDVRELSQKIEVLLKDPKLRDKFGQNGYEKVYREYMSDDIARKLLDLYQNLL